MTKNKRTIFKLAIPSIIENILQILLGTVDTYFVSTIGKVAISSVGVNNLFSNIFLTFFIAISTGTAVFTSRAHGEKDDRKINETIKNALIIGTFLSLLAFFINVMFGKTFINLMTSDEKMAISSLKYFNMVLVPIGFLCFMTILSSIIKSLGDTKSPMYTALFINIVNVVLDYILIKGIGSFEGFGITGAGIATTVSRLIGCLILIMILNRKTNFINEMNFKINIEIIKPMLHYGIPIGVEKLVMRIGQIFYGGMIISIGVTHYAAHNIAGTIEAYSYLPGIGFGVAAFALIGHSIGEKKYESIRKFGLNAYYFSSIFMVFIGIVFFIFAPSLAGIFTDDKEIIRLVSIVLRMIALFQPLLCSTQVITSSLQAIGDVKFPLFLTFFGIWVIRLTGTYILGIQLNMGLIGVWISYSVDVIIRGTILLLRFRNKTKSVDDLRWRLESEGS